jgi:hypothetical protein
LRSNLAAYIIIYNILLMYSTQKTITTREEILPDGRKKTTITETTVGADGKKSTTTRETISNAGEVNK